MGFVGGLALLFGLYAVVVGAISLLVPLRKLGIRSRKHAAGAVVGGLVIFVLGASIMPTDDAGTADESDSTPIQEPNQATVETEAAEATEETPITVVGDVTFEEVHKLFGASGALTDLQKEEFWERYRGVCVEWTGQLASLDTGLFGGINIGIKHVPTTLTFDVLISAPESEKDRFLTWALGNQYTYQATLKEHGGVILPITVDWGCD